MYLWFLFHYIFLAVLDVYTLRRIIYPASIQVVEDILAVIRYHYLVNSHWLGIIVCKGNNLFEITPGCCSLIGIDSTCGNMKGRVSYRRVRKRIAICCRHTFCITINVSEIGAICKGASIDLFYTVSNNDRS